MTENLNRDSQITASASTAVDAATESRLKELHTCLPAFIVAFDPSTQTASVQPAIRRIFTDKGAVNLPLCVDVPVIFPSGGGFHLTFPVAAGDDCILWFSERAIDNWHFDGGLADPAEYRMHDLSDAIAFVGLNSQVNKIPEFDNTNTQFRNHAGDAYFQISPTKDLKMVTPAGFIEMLHGGAMTIDYPTLNIISDVTITGQVTGVSGTRGDGHAGFAGDVIAKAGSRNVSLDSHTHKNVQTGAGSSGVPNP